MIAQALSSDIPVNGRARFGAGRRPSWRALALAAAAQAVFVPLALSLSAEIGAAPEERLVTVDLTAAAPPPAPPPPSPPAPTAEPPVDAPAAASAPPAPLALAVAGPVVPVRLDLAAPAPAPVPVPPVPASAPASFAAPAPAAAPPMIADSGLETSLFAGDPPRYPHESRRKREQGTAVLLVIVGTDGRVEAISVATSSGSRRLDEAALNAVRGWRWQPRRQAGQAVKVRGIVEIPFVLTSGRKSHHRADCDTPNSRCRPADDGAQRDRRGRMDGRHGDIGGAGAAGEEQPPAA